jgi:hypothetical protein
MASYKGLGSRRVRGATDHTGNNTGKWTVVFDPAVFNVNVPEFEVYKMVVQGAVGSSFDVFVDINQWDTSVFGQDNSWDPVQPLLIKPGQTLYFYYSDPVTDNTPPVVTCWLRYDSEQYAGILLCPGPTLPQ